MKWRAPGSRWPSMMLLSSALAQPVAAQILRAETPATPPELVTVEDPLNRTTPRDAIVAFIRAVDREDFVAAARYLQVTENQRGSAETLARDLKTLMDRYFSEALTSISDSP